MARSVSRNLLAGLVLVASVGVAPAESLPDPTAPALAARAVPKPDAQARPAAKAYFVSGVRIGAGPALAILNGTLVHRGDRVGSATVREIRPWGVLLDDGGRAIRVALLPGDAGAGVPDEWQREEAP